jgi:CBS-domain-containing membrane protein
MRCFTTRKLSGLRLSESMPCSRAWARPPVREAVTPLAELRALPPNAPAEQALEELASREVEQLPIVEEGRLLGLVRQQDLTRWLALHSAPTPG